MARPTDYTPELLEKAREYLADTQNGGEHDASFFPSVADFALNLSVARSTVYEWAKEHKEFSDILEDVLAVQENMLLVNGLNGEYNPTIAKLVLSKHGYRESHDHTTDGKALPTPILGGATKDE